MTLQRRDLLIAILIEHFSVNILLGISTALYLNGLFLENTCFLSSDYFLVLFFFSFLSFVVVVFIDRELKNNFGNLMTAIHIHANFTYNFRELINPLKTVNGPQRSPWITD